jgi:hypothetical protein
MLSTTYTTVNHLAHKYEDIVPPCTNIELGTLAPMMKHEQAVGSETKHERTVAAADPDQQPLPAAYYQAAHDR